MFLDFKWDNQHHDIFNRGQEMKLGARGYGEAIMMHEARMAPLSAVINRGANELLFENACCE